MTRPLSSRRYLKRVWRVPKDRGASEFLMTVTVKALRKHGWPATGEVVPSNWGDGFQIRHIDMGLDAPQDFWDAVSIASRIIARTYRADTEESRGLVMLLRDYIVTPHGTLKEQRSNLGT